MLFLGPIRWYSTARWFRAVDVPTTKPEIYGYKPDKMPKKFEPFTAGDSQRLENAVKGGINNVPVETDGLMTVDMKNKLCRPTFWDGPAFEVRRLQWFEALGSGRFGPIEPQLDESVEELFEKFRKNGDSKVNLEVDGTVFSGNFAPGPHNSELVLREGSPNSQEKSWVPTLPLIHKKKHLVRGVENAKLGQERPAFKRRSKKHLVFCIHGIGQLLSVNFEQINWVKDVNGLRDALGAELPDHEIQVLPVMWRQKLPNDINGVRPQQLFGTTNLAADALLDFVLYTEPTSRQHILDIVSGEMRRMFTEFCSLEPQFAEAPRISIIGHSLGSVLAYELVNQENTELLNFKVDNVFTLGSPIGVLELIQRSPTISKGNAGALYNIMRLTDPVAARMEPLVTKDALEVSPQTLPGGSTNILQQLRELTGDLATQGEIITSQAAKLLQSFSVSSENQDVTMANENKPPREMHSLNELKQFNRHGRLDFSVQESMDLSFILGLAGHLMYLDNPDVVRFLLNEILKTSSANKSEADKALDEKALAGEA